MLKLGIQTQHILKDDNLVEGFQMIRNAGFDCVDFSLHQYLLNVDIYQGRLNNFFDQSIDELEKFFQQHKSAAENAGIKIHQMHMPYPVFVEMSKNNDYLEKVMAVKSLQICSFLNCKYIVIHGIKLTNFIGSEELEWQQTRSFLEKLAPLARELNIIMCVENLYNSTAKHLTEGPCCNAKKMIERIDQFNDKFKAEVLGFCFDTGHANLLGLDFEKFITILGDRLKVLHIHDNDGVRDLHQVPFTFSKHRENPSTTDWNGFINGLKNIHFDKVLNFETGSVMNAFPQELKQDVLIFLAKIGKYFANKLKA
ncbi:MAG: sugar phosphate isomerase/epimerase [Selenomonadaceae bacterium]|nr:sugar phosphate isomerase/epimerase [Selenomonadaceae bacterium]